MEAGPPMNGEKGGVCPWRLNGLYYYRILTTVEFILFLTKWLDVS